ncbi:hypothetical protein C0J52_06774 [Blattella germanica]|nr:hypothetical protein C0J52_06774 [Blattella germanica]
MVSAELVMEEREEPKESDADTLFIAVNLFVSIEDSFEDSYDKDEEEKFHTSSEGIPVGYMKEMLQH